MGVAVLSVVALVASGASPVIADTPIDGRTLTGLSGPWGVAIQPGDLSVVVSNHNGGTADSAAVFDAGTVTRNNAPHPDRRGRCDRCRDQPADC